jgi:hypothetical protein
LFEENRGTIAVREQQCLNMGRFIGIAIEIGIDFTIDPDDFDPDFDALSRSCGGQNENC